MYWQKCIKVRAICSSTSSHVCGQEIMGYNAALTGPGPGTLEGYYAVAGCATPIDNVNRGCGVPVALIALQLKPLMFSFGDVCCLDIWYEYSGALFSQEFQLGKCQLQLRSQKTISTWRPGSRTMIRRSRKWSVNIHQWHPRFWAPWGMLALPHPTFLHLHSWQLSRRKVWLWSTTAVGIFLGMNHRNISLRCLSSTGVS